MCWYLVGMGSVMVILMGGFVVSVDFHVWENLTL